MNLGGIVDGHPDDSVALISRGKQTTYGELRRQVASLRGALVRGGIAPGDRVAIACANNRGFVVTYLATLGVGAVVVPVNPSSPAAELQRELEVVRAKGLVAVGGERRTRARPGPACRPRAARGRRGARRPHRRR
jgi:long-chain acyl-CoA synthetase